jgi:hypothetical protein
MQASVMAYLPGRSIHPQCGFFGCCFRYEARQILASRSTAMLRIDFRCTHKIHRPDMFVAGFAGTTWLRRRFQSLDDPCENERDNESEDDCGHQRHEGCIEHEAGSDAAIAGRHACAPHCPAAVVAAPVAAA